MKIGLKYKLGIVSFILSFVLTSQIYAKNSKNMVIQTSGYRKQNIDSNNAQQLYFRLFKPDNKEVKATLLILHGMQEHSGRYTDFAEYMAKEGFAVITYDHIGHGNTAQTSKDLGFFQHKKPAQQLVNDAENMTDYLSDLFPDVPHFLLGHSMGSFIARCLLQQAYQKFNGAVIVGTGGKTPGAGLAKTYFALMNQLAPKHRSNFVNQSFSKMNNKRFKNEPNSDGTNWLSADKNNRIAFTQDSLCGVPFSYNGFYALLSLNVKSTKKNWAKNIDHDFPLLFISGADDPIGNYGKGVTETVSNLKHKGFTNVEMKLYPNMRHEILNEGIKEEVYNDIDLWLKGR